MNTLLALLSANKGHTAAYAIIIAMGVAGYTNLLLELGQLRATDQYQTIIITQMTDQLGDCSYPPKFPSMEIK